MERFTMRIDDNVYFTKGKYKETIPAECESWDVRKILKRLADYEDTGLEPGEIKELVTGLTAMRAIVLTGAEAADYMAYRKSKQTKDKPPEPQLFSRL